MASSDGVYYIELCKNPIRFDPVSKATNVFYDDANQQVFAVRSGGTMGVVVKGPFDKNVISFRMEDRGEVMSIKFSPDRKILAIQRSQKSVADQQHQLLTTYMSRIVDINGTKYKLLATPGDGDCFFHSLSLALFGNFSQTRNLRLTICSSIFNNWNSWLPDLMSVQDEAFVETPHTYYQNMVLNNGWATSAEIKAASQMLKRKICVWLVRSGQSSSLNIFLPTCILSEFGNEFEGNEPVNLLLQQQHFQFLQPLICQNQQYKITTDTHEDKEIQGPSSSTVDNNINNTRTSVHKLNNKKQVRNSNSTEQDHIQNSSSKSVNASKYISDSSTNSPVTPLLNPSSVYTCTTTSQKSATPLKRKSDLLGPDSKKTKLEPHTQTNSSYAYIRKPTVIHPKDSSSTVSSHSRLDTYSLQLQCRKLGIPFEKPVPNETKEDSVKRNKRNRNHVTRKIKKLEMNTDDIPEAAPLTDDNQFNVAMDCIRDFELKQMSYQIHCCTVCHERRINMKMSKISNVCSRCYSEKSQIKMFSAENNMDPGSLPEELTDMTIIEQQLIARISPCINVHMLKHEGIASSGHCVTFPQNVNEPSQIFPRLPKEIEMIKVRKQGKNDTSKDFNVRRYKVQAALTWLKVNNPSYSNILISQERLDMLPLDGEISDIHTVEYKDDTVHINDNGPAPDQTEDCDGVTSSSVLLPHPSIDINAQVKSVVADVIGSDKEVTNKKGKFSIPWPTRDDTPLSEFTTQYFFTLAFPCLFPYGKGDFHINRKRTCTTFSDWVEHLLWYKDGRFAKHQYFKFVAHNIMMRKRALDNANYIVNQKLGDKHLTVDDLKEKLQDGDQSIAKKILYFSGTLRGTSQYWEQRGRELRSLIQFKINEGSGLPSFFTTGSCAEFHFKPLRRLLNNYIYDTSGRQLDLENKNVLFQALQENTHIVSKYFDLRTQDYFSDVMGPLFGVNAYWYRQEFAKSRGMVHWHGLCWRKDGEPNNLLHEALQSGLAESDFANKLAQWASTEFGLTALHPAGCDLNGNPRKDLWPPPEGSAPAPPEEKNPLVKLLMDVCSDQETLLEDHLLLSNRINLHRCSDYCLQEPKSKKHTEKVCRMEFGTESKPGKPLRQDPAIIKDKNGCQRLEMPRDHPTLVQHSQYHTQGWRANGDISIIVSKSDPKNPSVDEIMACEKYITGYACKGNKGTGALIDLYGDVVNSNDNGNGADGKTVCTKLLMETVKRDISAVEASYELSGLPLYRCSHTFQSVSLSGSRLLDRSGSNVTKHTIVEKYLDREKEDNSSLYNFICKAGKVPVITGNSVQATYPLNEDYCRTTLLLHYPNWRVISDIKSDDRTWTEQFELFLISDQCPNFVKAQVERAKLHAKNPFDEDLEPDDEELVEASQQPDWTENLKANKTLNESTDFEYDDGGPDYDWTASDFSFSSGQAKRFIDTIKEQVQERNKNLQIPDVNINSLNSDQKFAFNMVMNSLNNYISGAENFQALRLVVKGTAGSGKSFLIKCLVKTIRTLFNSNSSVQVLCPTGNSANLIDGHTIHSFLKLPHSKSKDMKPPEGSVGQQLQENCKDLKVLLVDERSMVGATTLGWMEFLCRHGVQINKNESWGGLPVVVFFGDDAQLPPVLDSPVYKLPNKNPGPAALHGALVWQEFKHAVSLNTIVRQKEDEQKLREVLMAMRNYSVTPEQAEWLQNFQWNNIEAKKGRDLTSNMMESGLFVFPSHAEEWQHNKSKLLELNKTHPIAKIDAVCQGSHASLKDSGASLQKTLFLSKNAKVMLSVNLCVEYGLFNGAMGIVRDIIYKDGTKPPSLPDVVLVEFPGYTGPPFIPDHPKLVPINPVERRMDCVCHCCKRKQIPLRLGWATTIHKCQGMTVGEGETNRYIIISPGTKAFESKNPGALFVALSRAKTAGGPNKDPDFAWHPSVLVNEDRLCHVVRTPTTFARNTEMSRLSKMANETKIEFQWLDACLELQEFIENISLHHEE